METANMASDSALSEARALLADLAELLQLAESLDKHPMYWMAISARDAARGSDDDLQTFLVSNELWGGAGSIADQGRGRRIERKLIELGRLQMQLGMVNARTVMWVT